MPLARAAISSGSREHWIPEATRYTPSPARNPTRKRDIISGDFGRDCLRPGISPFLTVPGTDESWLEGFCSTNDWQRAYNEINEFEKELSQWGAVIIKFWVQIDKDTQLERFTERQNTPEKQWKITDEDWRNRDKWDQYEDAVNEMLQKTSTEYAPWHILESVDKKYARIKALKIVIEELEKALG
jgi:hypothetical protein